ncbi:3-oxoacid CoA-transferase subunit B [Rubrivivax gelatinosus]|jgi:3-oxoacid CoA-transferase subunit B/acetate CoA/acetoacetate CoA-transferase beta subunit|uniref:3-oxoacid CoA-transferase subunit B/acetate CoA/acetoacetate CoA-transferase beta subunit n=1 Tax=Rubrivivax gelatinosus TaxID=28068 RepID=A0A4R2M0L0_RUBGE|nr:3-oxoacid CoA-transferase subunit B [Rubrivivax gelatinosus]MBK1690412.1 succinyl-CoA--3-ketoacid-CoA transferase [Rubrivivax gelatinosus]TCP00539.1 3-oxoacid CoA-transferase subunit B/acetate CoA/acetoacetate CoA-transferase beta subunit [Rubrivivax gelatinosus]
MDKNLIRRRIARRVARELKTGDLVNLGIGLPTAVVNFVPDELGIVFQSENGMLGVGPAPTQQEEIDPDITNAGGQPVGELPGAIYFDSAMSFTIIRGGHVDVTVLGALEVDAEANLANWIVPGKLVPGMGGAMDLVTGARRVIVAMEHCDKNGRPRVLERCSLPLTAVGVVDLVVTEKAVIEMTEDGPLLTEIAVDTTVDEVMRTTGARLAVALDLKTFGEEELEQ